jgi:hypothetical protein
MTFYIIHTLMALAEIHMLTILPNDMQTTAKQTSRSVPSGTSNKTGKYREFKI